VHCAHSERRAGGLRRGRHAGNTIGSWLGHSSVCLGPHSLWEGARSFSIEDEGCVSGGELASGGAYPKRADCR
jgi:hypothetical protein